MVIKFADRGVSKRVRSSLPPLPKGFSGEKATETPSRTVTGSIPVRSTKKGKPLASEAHLAIEQQKPWLALNMSRRTWYRREAEKKAKGEG